MRPRSAEPTGDGGPPTDSARWFTVAVWALVIAAFVVAILTRHYMFPHYTGDDDEPVYRFQAQMLLDGHLTLPATRQWTFFRPWLSGLHNGRVVMAFPFEWPAVLASSQAIFGTMIVAIGAAAAACAAACYAFARELLGRPRAVLATLLVVASPFFVVLSGTYLSYVLGLALEVTFAWLALRALRREHPGWIVASGFLWGLAFAGRSYDAVLFALPVAAVVLLELRQDRRRLARYAAWFALGALPLLAATAIINTITGGSPTAFSYVVQSKGTSTFFFGKRSVSPDTKLIDYTPRLALKSLLRNLWAFPVWQLGAYLSLAFAAFGAVRLWRRDPRIAGMLIGLVVVFPVGYIFWWASNLTVRLAWNGIGPHYYFPAVVPLAILASEGIAGLWQSRRVLAVSGLAAGVVLTAAFTPSKLDISRFVRAVATTDLAQIATGLHERAGRDALVVLPREPQAYVMHPLGYIANRPDLTGPVLYAPDTGGRLVDLLRLYPDRVTYRLVRQFAPGAKKATLRVVPLTYTSAPNVALHAALRNLSTQPVVTAYLDQGHHRIAAVIDRVSQPQQTYDIVWTVHADGTVELSGYPVSGRIDPYGRLALGIAASAGPHPATKRVGRSELRYEYRITRGKVQVLGAPEGWDYFPAPVSGWLPVDLTGTVDVTVAPGPSG